MEDRKLSEKESLELISRMIQETQEGKFGTDFTDDSGDAGK